jgi:hypothetical protein
MPRGFLDRRGLSSGHAAIEVLDVLENVCSFALASQVTLSGLICGGSG